MAGDGIAVTTKPDDNMKKLKEKLEAEIKAKKELEKLSKQIEITITREGLRIELIEGKDGTFYEMGSAKLSASGQDAAGAAGRGAEDPAQFAADRGPYRRHALLQ